MKKLLSSAVLISAIFLSSMVKTNAAGPPISPGHIYIPKPLKLDNDNILQVGNYYLLVQEKKGWFSDKRACNFRFIPKEPKPITYPSIEWSNTSGHLTTAGMCMVKKIRPPSRNYFLAEVVQLNDEVFYATLQTAHHGEDGINFFVAVVPLISIIEPEE